MLNVLTCVKTTAVTGRGDCGLRPTDDRLRQVPLEDLRVNPFGNAAGNLRFHEG